jgi:hypothetical protein
VQLTEAHRLAQARLGAETVQQLLTVWPLLDAKNIDGSFPAWLRASAPIIQTQRDKSSRLAAAYYQAIRTTEAGPAVAPFAALLAPPAPAKGVATSLLVTGPVSIRSALAKGMRYEKVIETAQARAASAGMRWALDGGRTTIVDTVRADPVATGWARVTSGNPCGFCVMLASRGYVYGADSVDFEAHDHCMCAAEPRFEGNDAALPDASQQWADAYQVAQAEHGSSGALAALNAAHR